MGKKYKTKKDPETGLLRIIALKDFSDVKKGDRGGLIEKETNLSQEGDCWVYENAKVSGFAVISENAKIYGDAFVYQNARIYGDAVVCDNALISGDAEISGNAQVLDNAQVYGEARVYGDAQVYEYAVISDSAKVYGWAQVHGYAQVYGEARICGDSEVLKKAKIRGDVKLWSSSNSKITTSIKNNKDYVILGNNRREFPIYSSKIKNITITDIPARDYINNIKTIRQLYGEEI